MNVEVLRLLGLIHSTGRLKYSSVDRNICFTEKIKFRGRGQPFVTYSTYCILSIGRLVQPEPNDGIRW